MLLWPCYCEREVALRSLLTRVRKRPKVLNEQVSRVGVAFDDLRRATNGDREFEAGRILLGPTRKNHEIVDRYSGCLLEQHADDAAPITEFARAFAGKQEGKVGGRDAALESDSSATS